MSGCRQQIQAPAAHVVDFSGAALSHKSWRCAIRASCAAWFSSAPGSPRDAYFRTMTGFDTGWRRWPKSVRMLEALCLWIYTPRAPTDGTVEQVSQARLLLGALRSTDQKLEFESL